jgi:hypothetical protein
VWEAPGRSFLEAVRIAVVRRVADLIDPSIAG